MVERLQWTRSDYRPYPYRGDDGRDDGEHGVGKVVRGGSWHDRPRDATVGTRRVYRTWQKVFDTGIRVIIEE